MPSEETLRREAEMAAIFERSDDRQRQMGVRLDRAKQRINKGRQGTSAQRAEYGHEMRVAGKFMVRRKR